ncbi:MAG: mannose-1-phosphate guanylyltransferase/mannose-6-phosphate isomerase [Smithella sp.]|jgi:mannose-1-phosphate guanylyltransferase/mannose-6-phosphate isomerase
MRDKENPIKLTVPVILAGGTGSRLWPLSRELYPKQLLALVNQNTMLQDTVLRTRGITGIAAPQIICNEEHRFMVAEQVRQTGINPAAIILEPFGRNTAPAIAVAALEAITGGENPTLLILPADHFIKNETAFHRAVDIARPYAESGKLVTFGILPQVPETGYGYIRAERNSLSLSPDGSAENRANPGEATNDARGYAVAAFVEKPDRSTAERYLASGDYFWNSGMFMFTAFRYLEELEKFAPEMLTACRAAHAGSIRDIDFSRLSEEAFSACPSNSIDYAVMEKTKDAVVVTLDAGWSDLGSWKALWEIGDRDKSGNVIKGDVLVHESKNCLIVAESRLVTAVGLEDHVIVETADAVLVASRDHVQDVKVIVNQLHSRKRQETLTHRKVYRPWGTYESIDRDESFQVKRISVKPGALLSLQMHQRRAEHWIIIKGTARVTKGEKVIILSENQSIYIPIGVAHRLENPGIIPLELIEVQSGHYLGEDDIVRFADLYGRQTQPMLQTGENGSL